jgi:hypothetical protein
MVNAFFIWTVPGGRLRRVVMVLAAPPVSRPFLADLDGCDQHEVERRQSHNE